LSSGEGDPFLSNIGIDAVFKQFQIFFQTGMMNGILKFLFVVVLKEEDVLFYCACHYPGFLC
jgi:hypothetical protein